MAVAFSPSILIGQDRETDPIAEASDTSITGIEGVQAIFDSIAAVDRIIEFLDERADGFTGDDERLLADRRAVRVEDRRALLWRAAESAVRDTTGVTTPEQVATIDSLLADDVVAQRSTLGALGALSSDLRIELNEAEGADRVRLGTRVQQLDADISSSLTGYHRSLALRDSLGTDVSEQLGELDARLRLQAEFLAARMAATESAIDAVRTRRAEGEPDLEVEVAALGMQSSSEQRSLEGVLELMESRDLETADFRRFLLVATGDLSAENLSIGVVESVVSEWVAQGAAWLRGNGANAIFKTLVFFAVLFAAWIGARVVRRLVRRVVYGPRMHISGLAREMIVRWASRAVLLLGALVALSQVGVDLGPVLAGFGVAGFVIAFALQETLSNFAAGMMILLYRPFDVGDVVDVAGASGKISNMSLVSTTVVSPDNQRFVVPNNKIWGDVIRNVTALGTRRVDLVFGVGYADDIDKAEQVLREVVHGHALVMDDPEPVIKVHKLAESSVELVARPWCRTGDYWDVYWDVTKAVKTRFDEEGISFPFPQRDVHVFAEEAIASGEGPEEDRASSDAPESPKLTVNSSEN